MSRKHWRPPTADYFEGALPCCAAYSIVTSDTGTASVHAGTGDPTLHHWVCSGADREQQSTFDPAFAIR